MKRTKPKTARKPGKLKTVRRRVAQVGVAAFVALGVVLAAYELRGTDEGRVEGPPPVQVRVLPAGSFQAAHAFAPYYVVPDKRVSSPAKLSRAATNRFVTRPEAALAKGGQAGSPQIVRLQLSTTTDEPLTVKGVNFAVVSDASPVKGWFTAQPACSFPRVLVAKVVLDSKRRTVRYLAPTGGSSHEPALALDRGHPSVLELQAAVRSHRVAWTAELEIGRKGGDVQTVKVSDGGKPFRVTSAREARGYAPNFGATGISGFVRDRAWDRGRVSGC